MVRLHAQAVTQRFADFLDRWAQRLTADKSAHGSERISSQNSSETGPPLRFFRRGDALIASWAFGGELGPQTYAARVSSSVRSRDWTAME